MYRIRFHGRGGQGIKTAANILAAAFFGEGFEVQDAPRYGAERRGAPIFAYVRAGRVPILERGVIARPGLVVVVDPTLVTVPAAGVLQGADAATVMLIGGADAPEAWRERLQYPGRVLAFPTAARAGAVETGYAGAMCAAAAARLVGVIGRDALAAAVRAEVAPYGSAAVAKNLEEGLAAFDAFEAHAGCVAEGSPAGAGVGAPPAWIDLPLDNVYDAAPDIHGALTSARAQTGLWRTLRPVIDYDRCNRCSWVCSTLCPDSAIAVAPDRTPRIDYEHCKGCMICAAVCPPHAISVVPEREEAGA